MRIPAYLKPGDTVVLIAPARSVIETDIVSFQNWVAEQGWRLELSPYLFAVQNQFAGEDELRAKDLAWALSHPTAKAVFTARGGYGAMRTLEALEHHVGSVNHWLIQQHPKWFVGFSDMTTIHLWLNGQDWCSIHGPVASQWAQQHPWVNENNTDLYHALCGNELSLKVDSANVVNEQVFSGELLGGNLSLIYAALGTENQPKTAGKVLLIEDLDEYLYHIDRMIRSCKYAGVFHEIKALLVGSMIDMKDNAIPFGKAPREIILDALGGMGFPILFDVEIGHDKRNHAVKLGCDITFDLQTLTQ